MARQEPIINRTIRPEEYDAAGELIVEAYRTLGNFWAEVYERQLRDVAARPPNGEVLVAEIAGHLVGSVGCIFATSTSRPLQDGTARRSRHRD